MWYLAFDPELFFPLGMVVLMGIIFFLFHYFHNKQVVLRALNKTSVANIQRVKNNEYVKLVGKALHVKEPMYAPISNRKCVFYQIKVEQKRGKNGWATVIDDTKATDFFIESNGEMAIVKLEGPHHHRKIFLDKDQVKKSGTFNDADDRMELYLKRHGKDSTNFLGLNKSMRYQEGIIEINEIIAVKGIGQWKVLKEVIPGFNYSKILTVIGTADQKLYLTDLKKATEIKKMGSMR